MFINKNNICKISILINICFVVAAISIVENRGGVSYVINRIAVKNVPSQNLEQHLARNSIFDTLPSTNNSIVFLGDSLIQNGEWSEILQISNVKNRGVGGDSTIDVLENINKITVLKPKKIFIMVGINDLYHNIPEEKIIENYSNIIKKITLESPSTNIYIQSLLPVNEPILQKSNNNNLRNDKIISLNMKIKELSKKYNIDYIDLYSKMLSENQMNPILTVDGIHINGNGYKIWVDTIKPYL